VPWNRRREIHADSRDKYPPCRQARAKSVIPLTNFTTAEKFGSTREIAPAAVREMLNST